MKRKLKFIYRNEPTELKTGDVIWYDSNDGFIELTRGSLPLYWGRAEPIGEHKAYTGLMSQSEALEAVRLIVHSLLAMSLR